MRFKNKIALVTGTSSGIGKKIVNQLIKEGAIVVATTRKKVPKKVSTKLEYYKIDVTSQSEWSALQKYINKKYKKLDILINNAGVRISGDIHSTSL